MPFGATKYRDLCVIRAQRFVIYGEKTTTKEYLMKILMVCLGNICRSPLAEGIMQEKIERRQLTWQVDSAGTGGWHQGEKPDRRSIAVASKNGIDISRQRARQFLKGDFEHFDLILAMDKSNYEDLLRLAPDPDARSKVRLLLDAAYGQSLEVADPYYDENAFEPTFRLLDEACDKILDRLLAEKVQTV